MALLLLRYGELGLKGPKVRERFERVLRDNILSSFQRKRTECILRSERGRIFLEVDDVERAKEVLVRVFGITSFSLVEEGDSDLQSICDRAAKYSMGLIPAGGSFAVRARRTGDQGYTSQDVGAKVGEAILDSLEGVKVDLGAPDVEIFIEVRNKCSYIFSDRLMGPGGLPVGSGGRVGVLMNDEMGLLAGWYLMKRGVRVYPIFVGDSGSKEFNAVESMLPKLLDWTGGRPLELQSVSGVWDPERGYSADVYKEAFGELWRFKIKALVSGERLGQLEQGFKNEVLVLYPLIGLSEDKIQGLCERVLTN